MSSLRDTSKALKNKFGKSVLENKYDSFSAFVLHKDLIKNVVEFLFENEFKMLIDIFAVNCSFYFVVSASAPADESRHARNADNKSAKSYF